MKSTVGHSSTLRSAIIQNKCYVKEKGRGKLETASIELAHRKSREGQNAVNFIQERSCVE